MIYPMRILLALGGAASFVAVVLDLLGGHWIRAILEGGGGVLLVLAFLYEGKPQRKRVSSGNR